MTDKRIVLITGGNKGIGLETARQLLAQGHTVLIGARDSVKGAAAVDQLRGDTAARAGGRAESVTIDVTNQESIAAAVVTIERAYGRLDTLVNNAGVLSYSSDGAASTTGQAALRETFETNFFGLIAVTQGLLPLLRKSSAGRIVNVTSILGSISEHSDPNSGIYQAKFTAYDCSKAAVNMYTNHLAHELKGTPIKVNAAHPGWVKTDMGGPDAPMEIEDGAKTSVQLSTLPENGPSGGYFHMGVHLRW